MLTVTRQAATEAECEAILSASYQVENPFSVPVLIIDPADHAPKRFLGLPFFRPSLKQAIGEKLARLLPGCDTPGPEILEDLKSRGYDTRSPAQVENAIVTVIKGHFAYNDSCMALALPALSPRFSVALCKRIKDAARLSLKDALKTRTALPAYPGFDAQHNFISLWHEIAHSVAGDNEAGAELTAALTCRYAFEDCAFLHVQADLRAASAVFYFDDSKALKSYGWPCVEAVEAAIALEAPPSGEDVRKTGEASYLVPRVDRTDSIIHVAEGLMDAAGLAFAYRDMGKLAGAADRLLREGAFKSAEQEMIAARFALAARRISAGAPAYIQPQGREGGTAGDNNPVRKFLLELMA